MTCFVTMPLYLKRDGELIPGEAQEPQTASAAESAARQMPATAVAVSFSRTGAPATGEVEDPVVLREFGTVPSPEELLGAE